MVLNDVQRLNQHVALRRCRAKKGLDLTKGGGVDHAAFRLVTALTAAGFCALLKRARYSYFVHPNAPPCMSRLRRYSEWLF